MRERAARCLHGRDYGKAALLYGQAEYLTLVTEESSPDTTELAVLAAYCLTHAASTQANEGRTTS